MPSRKKKNKREQKRKQKKKEQKQKFLARNPFGDAPLVVEIPSAEKMSEVLMEFIDPYWEEAYSFERMDRLLSVALIAWNAALVSEDKRNELIQSTLKTMPADVHQDFLGIVAEMIQRKETYFAHNKRFIVSYKLAMTPSGPHVSVLSTFDGGL